MMWKLINFDTLHIFEIALIRNLLLISKLPSTCRSEVNDNVCYTARFDITFLKLCLAKNDVLYSCESMLKNEDTLSDDG
uniref:Secreted protein n=1 Tax=Romanomermis culicivorax TaxID=13658 RepID=A0A915LAE8_ROMCU